MLALILIYLALSRPVYAYLDPGTGSYIFQLLVAGLLGGSFFARSFLKKLLSSVKKRRTDKKNNGTG